MKKTSAAILLALAFATPALAQQAPSADPAKLEAGNFTIDPAHTKVMFSLSHFGISTFWGLMTDFSGGAVIDPKAPGKSSLDVTVNMTGIDTTVPKLDEELKSDKFFDAGKFPTATFKSTAIRKTGAKTAKVTGNLTLHGVTKPVTLDVTYVGGGINPVRKSYAAGFNAVGHIKRTDFGVTAYAPYIGDDVTLTISTEMDKAP